MEAAGREERKVTPEKPRPPSPSPTIFPLSLTDAAPECARWQTAPSCAILRRASHPPRTRSMEDSDGQDSPQRVCQTRRVRRSGRAARSGRVGEANQRNSEARAEAET